MFIPKNSKNNPQIDPKILTIVPVSMFYPNCQLKKMYFFSLLFRDR